MLTLQNLKEMEPDTIFESGTTLDNSAGINMSNSGQRLTWVAVRGGIHDWAIYVGLANQSIEHIRSYGDKVHGKESIRKTVPCDDEAFAMYRD
jgi:hypothetical protein